MRIETIEDLRLFLKKRLPHARIYLFGSRARGDASQWSDVDIALEGDIKELPLVRFEIEESNFPMKVDFVDLQKAPYLKESVQKEGIRWQ